MRIRRWDGRTRGARETQRLAHRDHGVLGSNWSEGQRVQPVRCSRAHRKASRVACKRFQRWLVASVENQIGGMK